MPVPKRLTPIISVDAIEPCLPFWTALGFEIAVQVPHEEKVGFAMLSAGNVQLMYQSRASVEADLGSSGGSEELPGEMAESTTTLFVEVDDLDEVIDVVGDAEIVVPRRQTFYGMDELFVRAPCGTVVGFAARIDET